MKRLEHTIIYYLLFIYLFIFFYPTIFSNNEI
jgi:hypothetical protein